MRAADSLARVSPAHTTLASSHWGLLFTCSQQGREGGCLRVQPCGPSSKMTRAGPSSLQPFLEPQSSGTWACNSLLHLSRHRHPTALAHTPTGPGLDPVSGHISPLLPHSTPAAPCISAPSPVSFHWGGLSLRPAGLPPRHPHKKASPEAWPRLQPGAALPPQHEPLQLLHSPSRPQLLHRCLRVAVGTLPSLVAIAAVLMQ